MSNKTTKYGKASIAKANIDLQNEIDILNSKVSTLQTQVATLQTQVAALLTHTHDYEDAAPTVAETKTTSEPNE